MSMAKHSVYLKNVSATLNTNNVLAFITPNTDTVLLFINDVWQQFHFSSVDYFKKSQRAEYFTQYIQSGSGGVPNFVRTLMECL